MVENEKKLRLEIDDLVQETIAARAALSKLHNTLKAREIQINEMQQKLLRQKQAVIEAHEVHCFYVFFLIFPFIC